MVALPKAEFEFKETASTTAVRAVLVAMQIIRLAVGIRVVAAMVKLWVYVSAIVWFPKPIENFHWLIP